MSKKILMFGASWCAPCKAMKEVVKELPEDIELKYYDIEENMKLAASHSVRNLPTFLIVEETLGAPIIIDRQTGIRTIEQLTKNI